MVVTCLFAIASKINFNCGLL